MAGKKVAFSRSPKKSAQAAAFDPDAWVNAAASESDEGASAAPSAARRKLDGVRTKRLVADLDEDLHTRLKVYCAQRKISITAFLTKLLEAELSNKD